MNETEPLVSVNIPTYNEEKSLPNALNSLRTQTYENLEIIVIDSNSIDKTPIIAEKYGARVLNYEGKLLGARRLGVEKSEGDYILFLDADQVLADDTIERAIGMMRIHDMLILEESSYEINTHLQRVLCRERELAHIKRNALDPLEGGLLPRFFNRGLLLNAFHRIPENLFPIVVAHDHAIIYYEAYKLSDNIGILNNAIYHNEEETFFDLIKHNYRFGKSTARLLRTGCYSDIVKRKSMRVESLSDVELNSIIPIIMRSLAYQLGVFLGRWIT